MKLNLIMKLLLRNYPFVRGKNRMLSFAMKNISGHVVSKDAFGNKFLLNLDSYIDCRIFLEGSYEKTNLMILEKLIGKNGIDVFIDIGANIGIYSIYISSIAKNIEVFCFEPDKRNYIQLLANILLNKKIDKLDTYNVALSSKDSKETLYLSEKPSKYDFNKINYGTSSLIYNKSRHINKVEVITRKLDNVISHTKKQIFIKIDVEGNEYNVLQGMRRLLNENHCTIQVESQKNENKDVDNLLCSIGYTICRKYAIKENNYLYFKNKV